MKGLLVILILCCSIFQTSIVYSTNEPESGDGSYSRSAIISDIEALSTKGDAEKDATLRLTSAGNHVLDPLHAALINADYSIKHKRTIVIIIGNIADKSSIKPLMQVALAYPEDIFINTVVIMSLANYARTNEIDDFIDSYLSNDSNDPRLLQIALDFLAKQPLDKDKKWADKYSNKVYELKIRSMALYLGGLLGIESYKDKIMDTLLHRKKKTGEVYMLIGLSNLTSPEEFERLIKTDGIHLNSDKTKQARYHYYLNNGTREQKRETATRIVHEGKGVLKKDAISYLIQADDAEGLANAWLRGDKLVKNMLKYAGLTIDIGDNATVFINLSDKSKLVDDSQNKPVSDVAQSSQDDLSKAIFISFQTNNREKFISSALANKKQVNKYLATIAPAYAYKTGMLKDYKEQIKRSQESIISSWDVIYDKGVEDNIDWNAAKYVASNKYYRRSNGWEFLITHKGRYYSIQLPELTQYDDIWRLSSSLRWNANKIRSEEYKKWSALAERNNDQVFAQELKLLSNTTKEGRIPILRMRSAYGNVVDQYKLYRVLDVSTSQDDKNEGQTWLRRAANNNYAIAQYQLSEHLMADWYESQSMDSLEEARRNLIKSTEQNYIFALKRIAEHYARGSADFDLDLLKAVEYYQKLLDLDLATLDKADQNAYRFFRRDTVDDIARLQVQQKGLEANDPVILTELALLQLNNRTIESKTKGVIMLKRAVDLSYSEAQYQLGKIYISGNEVENKNITTAIELWNKASLQNHIEATRDLAYGFIDGKHEIDKNPQKAIVLADKLATYYQKTEADHKYSDSIRIWRVHVCNLDIEIKRNNDPSFVIPRVKTGRCAGL